MTYLKTRKMKTALIVMMAATLMLAACGGGSAEAKLMGSWKIDVDALKKAPAFKKQLEKNPGMEGLILGMFGKMKITISKTEIKMSMGSMGGQAGKEESGKILSLKANGNVVTMETEDGKNKKKEKVNFTIIDNDHISMAPEDKKDNIPGLDGLPLVRAK